MHCDSQPHYKQISYKPQNQKKMKIDFTSEQLAAIYHDGGTKSRQAIKDALGENLSKELPIQQRVQTFEDAVRELGNDHPAVLAYNSVKYGYAEKEQDLIAYLKLRIITTALNEGWEPKFTEGESRWYCWYDFISKEDLDKMSDEEKKKCRVVGRASNNANAWGGLVYSFAHGVSANSSTNYGSRLAFKNEELAEYAGKQFIDIYADYCFIPKSTEE